MHKRIITGAMVATMLCAVMMTSCSAEKAPKPSDNTLKKEVQASVDTESSETEISEVFETTVVNELYERFLRNEEKVYIDWDKERGGYYYTFEGVGGQKKTLEELTLLLVDEESDTFEGIEYSYIDCGMDGVPELLVKFQLNGDFYEYLLIKEFDGKLKMIYAEDAWFKNEIMINQYGYMYCFGSSSAADYVFHKVYIDADGNYCPVYSDSCTVMNVSESNPAPSQYLNDGRCAFLTFSGLNSPSGNEKDPVYTYIYWNEDTEEDDRENGYRSYFFYEADKDDAIYSEDNGLIGYFAEEGAEIIPLSEVEKLIAEKEEKMGVTDELKDAPCAEFKTLELPFSINVAPAPSESETAE